MKKSLAILALTMAPFTSHAERLTYDVNWGFITAGQAELSYTADKNNAYTLSALAWTTTKLFNLKERILIAGKNFMPATFTMDQIENEYRAQKSLTLAGDTATYVKKGSAPETFPTHGAVRDYLSALYQLRQSQEPLKAGQKIVQNVVGLNGAYRMELNVIGKKKIFSPALKWQDTWEVQPVLVYLAPKKGMNKDWRIYITTDANRTPVRIETKLKFGTFKVLLTHIGDEKSASAAPQDLQNGSAFTK